MPRGTSSSSSTDSPSPSPSSSAAGAWAAGLVGLQALGLFAAGLFLIVRGLQHATQHRGSVEVLGVLAIVVGVGVAAAGRALRRGSRGVRSPLLVLEIICIPIAISTIQGGRWYVGVPLAVVAIAVVVLMGMAGLLLPHDSR